MVSQKTRNNKIKRMIIVYISFVINILVAGFWGCILFSGKFPTVAKVFGPDSPGVRILSSMYLAIAFLSAFALIHESYLLTIATVLFPFQIIYKVISAFSVRNIKNPVVISNLIIAAIHLVSVYILISSHVFI